MRSRVAELSSSSDTDDDLPYLVQSSAEEYQNAEHDGYSCASDSSDDEEADDLWAAICERDGYEVYPEVVILFLNTRISI